MFSISKNNKEMRISRGDDSSYFPVELDYEFKLPITKAKVTGCFEESVSITINETTFKNWATTYYGSRLFFSEDGTNWKCNYNGYVATVNLATCGITLGTHTGLYTANDTFTIDYVPLDEVELYIFEWKKSAKDYIMKKTFRSDNHYKVDYLNGTIPSTQWLPNDNIIRDGKMYMFLEGENTDRIEANQYYQYQIIGQKLYRLDESISPRHYTITGKLPFYVIDDDIERNWN